MVVSGGNPGCASSMARPRRKDRHLPPCVYQRHGAYWYVRRGKWVRLGTDLHEALEAYAGHAAEPGSGMVALIDKVLAHLRPRLAASTYDQYRTAAGHLKRRLAEFRPEDVKARHVAAIKLDMAATPNMANRTVTFLRDVFSWAVEWQLVDSNPCIGIKRFNEAKRSRYITDEEFAAIYAQAAPRLQIVMDLLYLTGQRVTDVLQIRRADLKAEGIAFQPRKTARRTGMRLAVAWTLELERVVERAKGLRGNVHALTLLSGRRGKAPDYRTVSLQWREACARAGVADAQLRDLRAKSLTDAKTQGLDATALAAHASFAMTQRYIRRREIPVLSGPSFGQSKIKLGQAGENDR